MISTFSWNNVWKIVYELVALGAALLLLTGNEYSFWCAILIRLFVYSVLDGKLVVINAVQE